MIIKADSDIRTRLNFDKDNYVVTHTQDSSSILLKNKALREDPRNGFNQDRSYRRIASIPMVQWLEWTKEYPELLRGDREIQNKTMKKLLRKPENKVFRTVEGGI